MSLVRRVCCWMGLHSYEERLVPYGSPWGLRIKERRCRHCGYSPTWDR